MAVETVIYKTRSGAEGRAGLDAMLSWNETHHNTQTHSEEPVFEQYIKCYRAYYEGPSVQDPPKFQWPRSIEDYIREHANDTCSIMWEPTNEWAWHWGDSKADWDLYYCFVFSSGDG